MVIGLGECPDGEDMGYRPLREPMPKRLELSVSDSKD
jgi:hypothetical protein